MYFVLYICPPPIVVPRSPAVNHPSVVAPGSGPIGGRVTPRALMQVCDGTACRGLRALPAQAAQVASLAAFQALAPRRQDVPLRARRRCVRARSLGWLRRASGTLGLRGWQKRGGQLLVEGEEVFDTLALAREGLGAMAKVRRLVQFHMGFDRRGRPRQRAIQIRQRPARKLRPHVRRFLRGRIDGFSLFRPGACGWEDALQTMLVWMAQKETGDNIASTLFSALSSCTPLVLRR